MQYFLTSLVTSFTSTCITSFKAITETFLKKIFFLTQHIPNQMSVKTNKKLICNTSTKLLKKGLFIRFNKKNKSCKSKGPFPLRAWKRAFFVSFIDLRLKRAVKIEASLKKNQ